MWKSLKLEGERARTTLKVLEAMTYSCTSPQDLHELVCKVERLITDFRESFLNQMVSFYAPKPENQSGKGPNRY